MFARALPVAATLCAACSAPIGDPVAPRPDREEGRYGLLLMTHDEGEPGVSVSGQFAAWEGSERALVLHALALPEMAWLVAGAPRPGECRPVHAPRTPWSDAGLAHVELMSAGELSVLPPEPMDAEALRLQPREFPRVFFSLGGVVYDADAPEDLPFVAEGTYRVRAPGDELGAFDAAIRAPGPVELWGSEPGAAGLTVHWAGDGPAVLTLSREAAGETVGLQCAASTSAAGGAFTFPSALLAELGPGEAQLTVSAIRRQPATAPGLDGLDLFFVTRDSALVRVPADPE